MRSILESGTICFRFGPVRCFRLEPSRACCNRLWSMPNFVTFPSKGSITGILEPFLAYTSRTDSGLIFPKPRRSRHLLLHLRQHLGRTDERCSVILYTEF